MEELLKVKDIVRIVKVHPNTVRKWIKSGLLPVVDVPAHGYRVSPKALEEFLQVKKTKNVSPVEL